MSDLLYKKDSQLPLLNSLAGAEFFTVLHQGKNYRVQVSRLVQLALASQPAAEDTRRYWQTVPGYTVDDTLREITVDGNGVAFYDGATHPITAATLTYAPIAVSGNSRFDGIVLDTETGNYELIQGTEAAEPSTPGYNTQRYLLLAWILIDENGSQVEEPPQSHPRNQDQFLDQGGTNEISAVQAKQSYLKSLHFAGVFDNVASLPTGATAPTLRSFALVGTTAVSIYLYSVTSAAWVEVQGAGNGGGTSVDRNVATFADLATLPTPLDQENVYVADASGDSTVTAGWAIYKYILATTSWVKIAEQESLDQPASNGGGSFTHIEPYHFIFDSDLDTVSAAITLKGPKTFTAPDFSSNISGISFEVKLDSASTYTAAADVAALNSWVTSNVTTANTKFQFRKVATFIGPGEGSSVIRTTETITTA